MDKYAKKPETFVDFLRDYNNARHFGIPSSTFGGIAGAIRREQDLAIQRQKEEEERRRRGGK